MRRLVPILAAVTALALPQAASAANVNVTIGDTSYTPSTIRIKPGDTITFDYNSVGLHGAAFAPNAGSSPGECAAGNTLTPDCVVTFPNAGNYTIYDQSTCGSTPDGCAFTAALYVDAAPAVTEISAAPASPLRGQETVLTAATTDPNGDAASWTFDFGDGQAQTVAAPSVAHAYAAAGQYTVTVTATDGQGLVSAPTQTVITVAVPDSDGDGVHDDLDRCAAQPAATPDGCPIVAPLVPPRIVASATAATTLGLQAALASGVTAVLSCSDRCSGIFTLTRDGRTVGTATALLTSAGSKLVTVRFQPAAKRSLARARNARLLLSVLVTDALGRTQTERATVTLRALQKRVGKVPALGISDQQAATFSDPLFQVLRVRYSRLMTPWNSIFTEPERLDAWLQAARAAGTRPLVAFERERGSQCPRRPCRFPSAGRFARAFKAFRKKYPWVREFSPWNEVNSATQPTGKRPALAATYYNVVRANCRGCTIVAADLLDSSNIRRYVTAFLEKAKGKPRLWGLHNYTDTNRFRSRGTNALLQSVPGTVWLTETGGVVKFVTQTGKVALPQSERRAKKAMDYMFKLAERNAKRIKRIYVYQWKINNLTDRFDAGVVRPDGRPRPSYDVLTLNASIARKR